jgi:hypothetical protein
LYSTGGFESVSADQSDGQHTQGEALAAHDAFDRDLEDFSVWQPEKSSR